MRLFKMMLAGAAACALVLAADTADAKKSVVNLSGGVLLTAEEFAALDSSAQVEFRDRQALEKTTRSRIFKASRSGRFGTVGERYLGSMVHEGLYLDDHGFNASHSDGDVFAELGLDRFIGGNSTDVKFNINALLPTLRDGDGNQLDSSVLNGIVKGKGGLKINKNGISYNEETGDVSVSLKPSRKGFSHNQYVNLNLDLDGYGQVEVTYWLNEGRPQLIESETSAGVDFSGDDPSEFSPVFGTFIENVLLGDDGDSTAFLATAVDLPDTETTITSINYTGRRVNANSTTFGFGQMVGFVTDGKLLRGVYSQFFAASPSS